MAKLTTQEVVDTTRTHNYGSWRVQKDWKPMHIADAEGCEIIDGNGKRYLDFSSQLMCSNLGHKNRAVIDAIKEQAEQLPYAMPGYATDARGELSQVLLEVLPQGLCKFFFTTGGAEANEAAFKIARLYTGRNKIIARYRSYHGSTSGPIAATGDLRRWAMEPGGKLPGVIFAPEAFPYRCPLGHTEATCGIACANYIEHMIVNEGDVAAVIVEPIVGTNGVIVPPPEHMPRLREICTKHKVLLIADEVMSGWGRTGRWFAMEHWGVTPDILVTAKGITSAYMPLGLCATNAAIAAYFEDHYFAMGHTYEAHPMTLRPAIATIREMQRLGLVERSAMMGNYLGEKLRELQRKHVCIGEVRGKGLFWAIDLVKDRETKQPFATYADKAAAKPLVVDQIAARCTEDGMTIMPWVSHFVLAPPLIVSEAQIDFAITLLDKHLAVADAQCVPQEIPTSSLAELVRSI